MNNEDTDYEESIIKDPSLSTSLALLLVRIKCAEKKLNESELTRDFYEIMFLAALKQRDMLAKKLYYDDANYQIALMNKDLMGEMLANMKERGKFSGSGKDT